MEFTEVSSSNVAAVGQDGEDLLVRFRSGGVYRYRGAGHLCSDCIGADSVGRFVNSQVKSQFESERVEPEDLDADPPPIG